MFSGAPFALFVGRKLLHLRAQYHTHATFEVQSQLKRLFASALS
jgi:hypothetical protein